MSANFQRTYVRVFKKLIWPMALVLALAEGILLWAAFTGGYAPSVLPYMIFVMIENPLVPVILIRLHREL